MWKADIKPGAEYALREARSPGAPLQHVRILQHVRGKKWKAEWIDPNPGLVEYVESQNLIARWKDRHSVLRDEERSQRLRQHNDALGYSEESPIARALSVVFDAAGEKGLSFYRGILSGPPDALDRVKVRAGIDRAKHSPLAHVDRDGTSHAPFDEALDLAKAFCAKEPAAVLVRVEATEEDWSRKAAAPGGDYIVGLLNEYRAAWALIRQWAGHDAAIAQREARIQRLERLVWDAIYALQKAGQDDEARRLRRAVERE
ncbi:MAG: hypothetical protein A3I00_06470 [Betaproteobacteria bacterium RIFCSPLOWO2_02_FULL_64_12]|nr:MAG: hypothetical protein A3I00_06470 [Betaproteobacteria bacterium RIFCSPLOWO2_02_FULL_64_12]